MRNLLLLSFLYSFISFGQDGFTDELDNFYLKNGDAFWRKIYNSDLDSDKLLKAFKTFVVSNIRHSDFQEIDNRITFKVEGDEVNFKKYGGKWGNTLIFIQHRLSYLVQIDFKDTRYRVTIKDIFSEDGVTGNPQSSFEEVLTRKNRSEFKKGNTIISGLGYLGKHFDEKYNLRRIQESNDDW